MRGPILYAVFRATALITALCAQAATPATPGQARVQGFAFTALSNRILTPNGDSRNDSVIFTFDNPAFSDVTGKIFDVRGHLVATMTPGPTANTTLQWDGRSNNLLVPSGVYLYFIHAESQIVRGAVVVVR